MRIAVTGATGLIGRELVQAALARGDQVVALSRSSERARSVLDADVELQEWPEPKRQPPPAAALERADAVVHLLGEPIAQRWSELAKREIRDSRVLSTGQLVSALRALPDDSRPSVLVSQSATGFYGARGQEPIDERQPSGSDFLAEVVVAWEEQARQAEALGVRVALPRTGVVLAAGEGALAKMLPPFRLGIGGPVAGGRQYIPWIHVKDVVEALLHCVRDPRAEGALNLAAPSPATNSQVSHALGRVLHRPAVLPVPGFAVRALYGEMATVITTGQRAVPARLLEVGYEFVHPELEPALHDVLDRS